MYEGTGELEKMASLKHNCAEQSRNLFKKDHNIQGWYGLDFVGSGMLG